MNQPKSTDDNSDTDAANHINHRGKSIQPLDKSLKAKLPKSAISHDHAEAIRSLAEQAVALAEPTETKAKQASIITGGINTDSGIDSLHNNLGRPNTKAPKSVAVNQAAMLIRQKLGAAYASEPNAKEESIEAAMAGTHPSKHQRFINSLNNSGKSMAEIQTAWHSYYVGLPENEKHEVWREFYASHEQISRYQQSQNRKKRKPKKTAKQSYNSGTQTISQAEPTTVSDIKSQLMDKVSGGGKLSARHHAQSLLFGLGLGGMVLLILLLSFFNERVVAPFITPSRHVSATPIIIDPNSSATVGPESKIVIPKINLEVPVVYDARGTSEKKMQSALERGVVHYDASPNPGQNGNVVVVGHSSNNILNKGKYKFAFVLLKNMAEGDTFMMQFGGKRYVYKVYEKRIVKPTETSVMGTASKPNTATLITCDPPGTSLNRLIIVGEQISPDPSGNTAPDISSQSQDSIVPGNAPSLWQRIRDSLF